MISLPWNLRKGIEPVLRGLKGLRGRAVGGPGLGELLVLLVLLLGGLGHVLVEVLAALHNLDFLREGGKVGHAVRDVLLEVRDGVLELLLLVLGGVEIGLEVP